MAAPTISTDPRGVWHVDHFEDASDYCDFAASIVNLAKENRAPGYSLRSVAGHTYLVLRGCEGSIVYELTPGVGRHFHGRRIA
jgi:hypothetical protein